MSHKEWVIADTHFGHANILTFKRPDGSPLRPFSSLEEMDDCIVSEWNSRVAPGDRVYLLGDIAFNRRGLETLRRVKGRLVLVKGNHDVLKLKEYLPYFDDIRGVVAKGRIVLSHVPLHPDCMERWTLNVHGHLHAAKLDDPRYVCVSVEQTDYAPVDLATLTASTTN
jgi:calcineurin-like phosphoesterase family protein